MGLLRNYHDPRDYEDRIRRVEGVVEAGGAVALGERLIAELRRLQAEIGADDSTGQTRGYAAARLETLLGMAEG